MPQPSPSAVLDPTVLVSAAIAVHAGRMSAARILVEELLIRRGALQHFTSAPILYELEDVLGRARVQIPHELAIEYADLVVRASTLVTSVQNVVMGCRDPGDDKVLECAMNAGVRYIVTRDKDLLDASPAEKYAISKVRPGIRDRPVEIVTVETFVYRVLGHGEISYLRAFAQAAARRT